MNRNSTGLIVGGSSGMSLAAARKLLDRGAGVILLGRSTTKLAAAKDRLSELGPVDTVAVNLHDEGQTRAFIAKLDADLERDEHSDPDTNPHRRDAFSLYSESVPTQSNTPTPPHLKVAILAPIAWRVPPRHYGPWERFASLLTEGLVARGIDVTLFATGDSLTTARLVGTAPRGYAEDPKLDAKVWECLHISAVFERADNFDLIHNSFDFLPLTYSGLTRTPVLTTIHGFSSPRILPVYAKYNGSTHYVAISDADRNDNLDYVATIHHGIEIDEFVHHPMHGGYLLFFGRIHPDKGAAEAIEVASRIGVPLVLAGIIQDQEYFEREVAPHLDEERVRYIGSVGPDARCDLLGNARGLLHLINFDEPFGLSVVESMACGTPVIAIDRGSMAEIIQHGENGFLVNSVEEAAAAVQELGTLDRHRVRASVATRFSRERMVDDYIRAYLKVVETTQQNKPT